MDITEPIMFTNHADKSQVPPIHQKRILAFVNQFIISTVTFLNSFIDKCDTKFLTFETKLQKLESSLTIIESKLSSIPFEEITGKSIAPPDEIKPKNEENTEVVKIVEESKSVEEHVSQEVEESKDTVEKVEEDSTNYVQACEHEYYKKYFKMLQFGVPSIAVKQKMESDGVDSTILDLPHKLLQIDNK